MATDLMTTINKEDYISLNQFAETVSSSEIKRMILSSTLDEEKKNKMLSFASRFKTSIQRESEKRKWLKKNLSRNERNSILNRR